MPQWTTLPESSLLTSRNTWQWGFSQRNSVTVPFKVIKFCVSYSEPPWCANTGTEAKSNPAAKPNDVTSLRFMRYLTNQVGFVTEFTEHLDSCCARATPTKHLTTAEGFSVHPIIHLCGARNGSGDPPQNSRARRFVAGRARWERITCGLDGGRTCRNLSTVNTVWPEDGAGINSSCLFNVTFLTYWLERVPCGF
jgi:hypothetical protein